MDAIDDAAYRLVHEYPGGANKLAPLVNMQAGTLLNKANPDQRHQLTIREAVAIETVTRRPLMLHAHAMLLGHTVIPLGDFANTSDIALLELYAKFHSEIGDTAKAVSQALRDGKVTKDEVERVRRELLDVTQSGFEFLARLEALAQ